MFRSITADILRDRAKKVMPPQDDVLDAVFEATVLPLIERVYPHINDREVQLEVAHVAREVCPECIKYKGQMNPPHFGSPKCESGSIASGGKRSHCTCDICF